MGYLWVPATISSNNLPPFRATAPGPRGPGPAWDRISSNCSTQGRFDLYKNDAEKFLSERENAANMAKPISSGDSLLIPIVFDGHQ